MAVNRYYSSNAVDTTLINGVDASATEIVLASTQGMPQSYPFTLALDYDTSSEELVNVVGVGSVTNSYKIGVVLNTASYLGRGIDGNSATSHSAGAPVKHVISARDIREAQVHIDASTKYTVTNGAVTYDVNLHGIADGEGSVVGTAKTQTLTNKSISGSTNTLTNIANTSIVGTAVTLAGTQTLTNKTLTAPKINEDVAVTATATELNVLDGITASTTELNYVDGVTSNIQTQLDGKVSLLNTSYLLPAGMVAPFAGANAPTGWLLCAGQLVSRTTYAALYSAVGINAFGTDTSTDFYLPDLRGRVPAGVDNMGGSDANRLDWTNAIGTSGGEQKHLLTSAESGVPSHTHTIDTRDYQFGDYPGGGGSNVAWGATQTTLRSNAASTNANGAADASQAHNNMQPTILLNYIIKY